MLKVDQYAYIRTAYRIYGKKIRELARETGHSRNTIKKALREEYSGYQPRNTQPFPVLGDYRTSIDSWLKQDKDRPKKQRHTATRIHNRLRQEHGFTGSESTVRRYVRGAKLRLGVNAPQAFIPAEAQPVGEAEVDWGNCMAILAGRPTRLKLFCMRSKYSGKHFVRCYPCERQQSLFDAHVQAFSYFGGVFPVLIYDNLTTAVQRVFRGKKRTLQETFERFRGYYSFTPRFCNPGQGHEKGGVEGLVGYGRRNYMVPVPEAENLAELNDKLLKDCVVYGDHRIAGKQGSVNERFEQEKEHLLSLPRNPFSNLETVSVKVDKYATVNMDKNRYSVPTAYAGFKVKAFAYVDHVEIFYSSKKIAAHWRLYGNNKWSLDPLHYLDLISQRPQSFDTARPILSWRQSWPACLEELLDRFRKKQGETKGIKEFISILLLYKDYDAAEIEVAVKKALAARVSSGQAVRHMLRPAASKTFSALDDWQTLPPADVSVYQQIGGAT